MAYAGRHEETQRFFLTRIAQIPQVMSAGGTYSIRSVLQTWFVRKTFISSAGRRCRPLPRAICRLTVKRHPATLKNYAVASVRYEGVGMVIPRFFFFAERGREVTAWRALGVSYSVSQFSQSRNRSCQSTIPLPIVGAMSAWVVLRDNHCEKKESNWE